MVRLLINYYNNPERADEHLYCVQQNIANRHIDSIVCFCDDDIPVKHEKLIAGNSFSRPTFQHFFNTINFIVAPNDISIIANLDIYFNDTLSLVHNIKHNEAWCITRWDAKDNGIRLFDTPDSQDVWVFRGEVKPIEYACNLRLGAWGVDNRLAHELAQAGYEVKNPARSIQTIHVHKSDKRPERTEHNVIPPPYLTIWPTHL